MESARKPSLGLVRVALLFGLLGCQPAGRDVNAPAAPHSAAPKGQLELREAHDRPPIGLVARNGDPVSAVSLALAHDFGAAASVALGDLLALRLRAAGIANVQTRAHGVGLVLSTTAQSAADAARFVQVATQALAAPVQPSEVPAAQQPQHRVPSWPTPAEAAVGACSGELAALGDKRGGVALAPPTRPSLEHWRTELYAARSAAFGAAGSAAVLDAAARAVSEGPEWPSRSGPNDPWPGSDTLGVTAAGERRVAVAYRIADPARAAELARSLGSSGSRLGARLSALESSWSIDRVIATSRPRGACLRLDIRAVRAEPSPPLPDVARVVAIVNEEAAGLDQRGASWTLDEAILRPGDPREAAAAAAWRALSARLPGGPVRRFVSYAAREHDNPSAAGAAFSQTVAQLEAGWRRARLEPTVKLESGQGELWAIVGTQCGTSAEGNVDAGVTALLLRSLAAQRSSQQGVSLQAWATPDGGGLVAHAPRRGPDESAEDHAARVGDALGRALVAGRLSSIEVAEQRELLLEELGPYRRGLAVALESAGGGHPSWLDARGTWHSLSGLTTHELESRRRSFVSGPLRVALIANQSPAQGKSFTRALELWLRPHRLEPSGCTVGSRRDAKPAELRVEASETEVQRAYLTVPVSADGQYTRAAEWMLFLLNRPGGLLERSLAPLPGSPSARATLLGGQRAAALVVDLRTEAADSGPAVGALLALFERLSRGAATEADAHAAQRHFGSLDAEATLDPRRRLLDLWRAAAPRATDLATLRRFQQSFGPPTHVVVTPSSGR